MVHNLGILVAALAFTYLSLLAGFIVFRVIRFSPEDSLKRGVLAIITGYGVFGFVGTFLAGIGWFTAGAIQAFSAAIVLLSFRAVREHFVRVTSPTSWRRGASMIRSWFQEFGFLKGVLVAWLLFDLFIVFVPLTGHDTLDYHFPIIQSLIREGRLTFEGTIPAYPYLPVGGEVLYASSMLLASNTAEPYVFQVLQYGMLILFPLLFYIFLKDKVQNSLLALVGAAGILTLMDFAREAFHGGYVDLFGFLFGIASVLLVADMVASGRFREPALALSALLLGASLGVKYTGFFFGAVSAILVVFALLKSRARILEWIRIIFPYTGFTLLTGGFWYLKNYLAFGNPVYPFGSDAAWLTEIHYFLVDRTFLNFLLFPFLRYGQWFLQEAETSSRLVVLGFFILLYAFLLVLAIIRKRLHPFGLCLFIFFGVYLAFLFMTSHQYRFLIPVTLLLPPLLALFTDQILRWLKERSVLFYRRVITAIVVFTNVVVFVFFIANIHYFEVKFRYIAGYYTEGEYILEIGGQ